MRGASTNSAGAVASKLKRVSRCRPRNRGRARSTHNPFKQGRPQWTGIRGTIVDQKVVPIPGPGPQPLAQCGGPVTRPLRGGGRRHAWRSRPIRRDKEARMRRNRGQARAVPRAERTRRRQPMAADRRIGLRRCLNGSESPAESASGGKLSPRPASAKFVVGEAHFLEQSQSSAPMDLGSPSAPTRTLGIHPGCHEAKKPWNPFGVCQ